MSEEQYAALKKARHPEVKPHKYHAVATVVDGIKFPSKKQAKRYTELKLLQRAGTISDLTLEVEYPISIGDHKICSYIADFTYLLHGIEYVVEDSKGIKTPLYRLKKKLMKAVRGIDIKET